MMMKVQEDIDDGPIREAFDTLNYDLFIAKLNAHGNLTKKWHRTKPNTTYSSWEEVTEGVSKIL